MNKTTFQRHNTTRVFCTSDRVSHFDDFEASKLGYGRSSGARSQKMLRFLRKVLQYLCLFSTDTFGQRRFPFPSVESARDFYAEQTWSLNYRAHGIRQTFAVNSISTPVRTRETFPPEPPLSPLFNHLPLPRDRDKPNSCKYISNERLRTRALVKIIFRSCIFATKSTSGPAHKSFSRDSSEKKDRVDGRSNCHDTQVNRDSLPVSVRITPQ